MKANEIENRKSKLDLRPALAFVDKYDNRYVDACKAMNGKQQTGVANVELVRRLKILSTDQFGGPEPQVSPRDISLVLMSIPPVFLDLSLLEAIDYVHNLIVPVPIFESDGTWTNVDLVPVAKFPREGDHPTRILIGRSNGDIIFPSALPNSVWNRTRSRWFYQLHVFLHEFFHTIELLRRGIQGVKSPHMQEVVLRTGSSEFTLQAWWDIWAKLYSGRYSGKDTGRFVTRYAASYAEQLNVEAIEKNPVQFNRALAEQICESFVGYILGIAPNDEDEPDFKRHSPMEWGLMDNLAKATLVK